MSSSTSNAAPSDLDAQLIAIISEPLRDGETAAAGFARKEAELRALFAGLRVLEAHALHRRLVHPRANDPVAIAFARLTAPRRLRLVEFLADARRRAALAATRT
jgi:hypothetical protein